jgi:hypothetical protein
MDRYGGEERIMFDDASTSGAWTSKFITGLEKWTGKARLSVLMKTNNGANDTANRVSLQTHTASTGTFTKVLDLKPVRVGTTNYQLYDGVFDADSLSAYTKIVVASATGTSAAVFSGCLSGFPQTRGAVAISQLVKTT